MKNKKAFEMTISTLVLMVLGIVILIAIILAVTGGLDKFKSTTEPFLETSEGLAIKTACQEACNNDVKIVYCCQKHEFNSEEITCEDPRLEIDCAITCEPNFCE